LKRILITLALLATMSGCVVAPVPYGNVYATPYYAAPYYATPYYVAPSVIISGGFRRR